MYYCVGCLDARMSSIFVYTHCCPLYHSCTRSNLKLDEDALGPERPGSIRNLIMTAMKGHPCTLFDALIWNLKTNSGALLNLNKQ